MADGDAQGGGTPDGSGVAPRAQLDGLLGVLVQQHFSRLVERLLLHPHARIDHHQLQLDRTLGLVDHFGAYRDLSTACRAQRVGRQVVDHLE